MFREEFMVIAKGSNENSCIYGSKDAVTTGGHKDTKNRRMISHYGLEDCCGFMHQMISMIGYVNTTESYSDSYTYKAGIDPQKYGDGSGYARRMIVGGCWYNNTSCGSRCRSTFLIYPGSNFTDTNPVPTVTIRGSSDPKIH